MKRLVPRLSAQEWAAAGGLALVFAGLALWYVPAALAVTGALVLLYVFLPDQGESGGAP